MSYIDTFNDLEMERMNRSIEPYRPWTPEQIEEGNLRVEKYMGEEIKTYMQRVGMDPNDEALFKHIVRDKEAMDDLLEKHREYQEELGVVNCLAMMVEALNDVRTETVASQLFRSHLERE